MATTAPHAFISEEVTDQDDLDMIVEAESGAAAGPVVKEQPIKEGEDEGAVDDDADFLQPFRDMGYKAMKYGLILLLVVYLLAAFIIDFQRAIALFVITVLCGVYAAFSWWSSQNPGVMEGVETRALEFLNKTDSDPKVGLCFMGLLLGVAAILMAVTVRDSRNLVSLLGLVVFIFLTYIFSWNPSKVKWRPVVGALFFQFLFGWLVITTSWGLTAVQFLGDTLTTLLGYTTAGSEFVFGWLVDGSLFGRPFSMVDFDGNDAGSFILGPPFFFNVLPTVIFFSALMNVGYYLRVIPWMVRKIGYALSILLGTSASESLSAAGNIFVGQTEAPLLVRPFMKDMTESELHAIMTGGFATIAGSVFGIYVFFGVDPVAILAASVMSAPAALAISKITFPETEESPTAIGKRGAYDIPKSEDSNIVHAATSGAVIGTQLLLNIAGNLIAFLALFKMLDELLMYLGDRVDIALNFTIICQYIFYPVAWLMGVDAEDCNEVATLLGFKIFLNEFVAYEKLTTEFADQISPRSFYIVSYALCGFSNFGSIGIQLGGLGPLAPNQTPKLAKLVFSAMIAGNTACLLTACIAGIFYDGE